jgi:hypothetical protein
MQDVDVWDALVQWWGLPPMDACTLWKAVRQSQALPSVVLRQNIAHVATQQTVRRFVQVGCSPTVVLRTLDALEDEGCLSHQLSTALHACIRGRMDPSGQWRRCASAAVS